MQALPTAALPFVSVALQVSAPGHVSLHVVQAEPCSAQTMPQNVP
jgi:hypothetical protein